MAACSPAVQENRGHLKLQSGVHCAAETAENQTVSMRDPLTTAMCWYVFQDPGIPNFVAKCHRRQMYDSTTVYSSTLDQHIVHDVHKVRHQADKLSCSGQLS